LASEFNSYRPANAARCAGNESNLRRQIHVLTGDSGCQDCGQRSKVS
jgi:hypothetical protein